MSLWGSWDSSFTTWDAIGWAWDADLYYVDTTGSKSSMRHGHSHTTWHDDNAGK